jgi:hypothetical protein
MVSTILRLLRVLHVPLYSPIALQLPPPSHAPRVFLLAAIEITRKTRKRRNNARGMGTFFLRASYGSYGWRMIADALVALAQTAQRFGAVLVDPRWSFARGTANPAAVIRRGVR